MSPAPPPRGEWRQSTDESTQREASLREPAADTRPATTLVARRLPSPAPPLPASRSLPACLVGWDGDAAVAALWSLSAETRRIREQLEIPSLTARERAAARLDAARLRTMDIDAHLRLLRAQIDGLRGNKA